MAILTLAHRALERIEKMTRALIALMTSLIACGPPAEDPDGEWNVTVTGTETNCVEAAEASYQAAFVYQIFYDTSSGDITQLTTQIQIDGEDFANGVTSGCNLEYESAIWLEEDDGGDFQWQIKGEATYQGAASCGDLPDGVDWQGTETLTVTSSENDSVPVGCVYNMELTGVFKGG